jgi:hypothetical protein
MFNEDSLILQNFIALINKKYNPIREKKKFLSKTGKNFIEKIITWMDNAEESFLKVKIKEIVLDKTKEIPKGKTSNYIPDKIKEVIERMNWIGKKMTFSINNITFNVFFIHPLDATEDKIYEWFDNIIKRIYYWLYIISIQNTKEYFKNMNIYFYFTNLKKILPKNNNEILGEINVNTAYTFSCNLKCSSDYNEIYIYRKEEWFKVFIHETFHAFGLDFTNMSRDILFKMDRKLMEIFPLKIDLRLYETYSELWAEIINIIYIIHISNKTNKISKIIEYLKIEQLFSLFQALKILKYNKISYKELYETTEIAKTKRIYNYKESSPIISYYVLKSICMMNIGEFIEWTSIHNDKSFNFKKMESNIFSFIHFIKERYDDKHFLKAVEFTEDYYTVLLSNKNKFFIDDSSNINILNTLRMSIFEYK